MAFLAPSVAQRLQSFVAAGGHLASATTPPAAWLVAARATYSRHWNASPAGSRIERALYAPADYTIVGALDAQDNLVGAMSYRTRTDPTDLFVTSIGSTGDLGGTGVALLTHLAQVSLQSGLSVRASLDLRAINFYSSLGWVEIEPGDPGHKWRWPLASRTELAELATLNEPTLGL
jgi:hypothetical protein